MVDPLEDDAEEPLPIPTAVRRVGYSSRGSASPVGETIEPSLTLGDPRADEQAANALRRRYDANQRTQAAAAKEQATLEKKTRNAALEGDFRAKGQKFYTDSFGDLKPEVDEAGQPRFAESNWKKAQIDAGDGTKRWALTRRGESGQTEMRAPKLVESGDVKDPNLYHDFGGLRGEREVAGHVDDLVNSPDTETAREAAAYRLKRNAALRKESLKPLQGAYDSATAELDSAKLRKTDLEGQSSRLQEQIAQLDANPAIKQTAGGFLGLGAEPTPEARRLQAQRQSLQTQADDLAKQSSDLATSAEKGGSLHGKHERAQLELDAWSHQSKLGELDDLATQRRTWLRSQNRAEQDDPVLAQILTKQDEFGVKASETAKKQAELQKTFDAERAKTAATDTATTAEQVQQQAADLAGHRNSLAQAFQGIDEDLKAGRIDQPLAAQIRQSLIESSRDYTRSVGALAGKADAVSKRGRIEADKANLVRTQGEELYALDKNAGSTLQRMVEGTRDKDGTKRELLSQNTAIVEAAKAAAFFAGDSDYSSDPYAKLPGKQIAINPAAFTRGGLKAEGAAPDAPGLTWRQAIDQAVKSGDLDPKRAEPMRRELATREMLATEAAVDAVLDNNTFGRWLSDKHPELYNPDMMSAFHGESFVAKASPALRTAAKEYLASEPTAAAKLWDGLKMVGIGALGVGTDAVRAVLPEDNAGAKAVKEFADGLNSLAMDPRLDKHWIGMIGQGLGSSLAFATPAGAAGGFAEGAGLSAKLVKWTVGGVIAATGAAAQGQQMYDEARAAGADKEVADGARWLGAILGASEVAPLGDIVRRFGSAKAFSLGAAAKAAVAEIGEETVQEIGQQSGNNAVARMLYDQNRSMFDGLADSAIAAGGSAAIMTVLASVAAGVRYHRTVGLLNAAQQSRGQSEETLATVYARPDVQAVTGMLPPASSITGLFAERRTQIQQAIQAEAAKENPSEDALLGLHEQLAQVEIAAGSTARQLAAHALDVADAAAQAQAAPDHFQLDPETQQPINDATTFGANRDAATALVRLGAGVPLDQLTEAEQQGLQIIGAELGSEMVRPAGGKAGRPIITDKARQWAAEIAPATANLLTATEAEQIAQSTANVAGQKPARIETQKGASTTNGQKEKGRQDLPLNPSVTPAEESSSPAPAAGASASVSFTNDAGKTERVVIPTGAVIPSSKAPVRDQATAEQWLAETRPGPVRDVEYFATGPNSASPLSEPAKPNAGQAVAPQSGANGQAQSATPQDQWEPYREKARELHAKHGVMKPHQTEVYAANLRKNVGEQAAAAFEEEANKLWQQDQDKHQAKKTGTAAPLSPGALMPHLVAPLRAKGVADEDIARTAVSLSKHVNEAVAKYRGLFGGRVEVSNEASGTGGLIYDAKRDALVISTADLSADAQTIAGNPERIPQLVREEAIHRAAVQLEKTGQWQASALWSSLTPSTRDSFVRAYNQGRDEKTGAKTTDDWAMGHEMVRMLVQGRLAVQPDGRIAVDGAAISEETASPALLQRMAEVLRKVRDYFTDLAGSLTKDGNSAATVGEVHRVVKIVSDRLSELEATNARAAAGPTTAPAANTAATIQGEQIKGDWHAFAPESGTLGIPRTEMPQVKSEHRGALIQFLAARDISHTSEEVQPTALKPTQQEFSTAKVDKARSFRGENRPILVSADNYVVDGHHQYVAALQDAPATPIPIIRLHAPIRQVIETTRQFPSTTFSEGSSAAPAAAQPEAQPASPTAQPTDQTANPTEQNPERTRAASALGLTPEQVGSVETVTHKGRSVRVVNIAIEAGQANTSHTPEGTVQPNYPQELQPRDRSGAIYREQQRKIAANPNWGEEMITGASDHGTPIMAQVGGSTGKVVTVAGNGRANGKALMYAAPDLAATAAKFKAEATARAREKGIDPAAVAKLAQPVFARFLLDDLSPDELRAFAQASNEFSGAATNAIEQAKVDASRLTPAVLASFNPEFDLDSAKNDDFRREFVRSVIGRAENITGPDLRRRVQAALFAKAFGDTEAGMAAFSRLAGEDDEGVRNLVRAMLDVAPAFAAMQDRIAAGTLHPLDLAPALTRAVQEIAVTLREKPAKQSADVALDGLINQGELATDGARDPLTDATLRFLVSARRNRADLVDGLSRYLAGVYAAGDPRQSDMFGAATPSALDVLATATDPNASDRRAVASAIGRVLASSRGEEIARGMYGVTAADYIATQFTAAEKATIARYEAAIKAEVERTRATWTPWYARYESEAPRFTNGTKAVARATDFPEPDRFYVRKKPKGIGRIVEKAIHEGSGRDFAAELRDIKDTLGATFVVRTRADFERAQAMLVRVFGLDPATLDTKDTIARPWATGYRDIKIRPEIRPGVKAEIIFITPEMHVAKTTGPGHVLYELERTLTALQRAFEAEGRDVPVELYARRKNEITPAATWIYSTAWAADSVLFSQSARDISGDQSQADTLPAGNLSPEASKYLTPPSLVTEKNGVSTSSSLERPMKNSAPGGGLNLSGAVITPITTNEGAKRQPLKSSPGEDLFGGLLDTYAQKLPAKAKRSKAEIKKVVAAEIPALANNAGAIDELFSLAQTESPLTNRPSNRSGETAPTSDETKPDAAQPGQNGGRAFTELESNDLGPLFGDTGPAGAATDAGQPGATPDGDVAGSAAAQSDQLPDGAATSGAREAESGTDREPANGSLSVDLPGSRSAGVRRVDARAAAEARRVARIARSRARGVNEQNHRITEEDTLVDGGTKTRLRTNVAIIRILKSLDAEKRAATPEEKRTLAKYVGWGALSQAFDKEKGEGIGEEIDRLNESLEQAESEASRYQSIPYYQQRVTDLKAERDALERWDRQWGEGYRALKELLTPEEWAMARDSTENAHYTDRRVIGAMWSALEKMGFRGGRVLEPAGGVGHFFGLMPEETMRASELFGTELDSISGGIFKALYPDAQIQVSGFESARLPDNAFDLAISNVPFAKTGPVDPIHDKAKLNLHNYFFAKALDKVRPNGLIAFITTANTMEASPAQRAYLAERSDFVGAVRLPNDAFAANAGTAVTTDIIFLRKKDGLTVPPWAESWQAKQTVGEDTIPSPSGDGTITVPITVNEYFVKHPEMVLGTHSMNGEMYAGPSAKGQYTVNPTEGDILPKLETALAALPAAYQESGETAPITIASTSQARNGAFSTNADGELGIYRDGIWKPLAEADPENFGEGKIKNRRKAAEFVTLRDAYLAHLTLMGQQTASNAAIAQGIVQLNQLYDKFASQWGTLENDRGRNRSLKTDPGFWLVKGLERIEEKADENGVITESIVKSDVLKKRTIFPNVSPTTAANALDALRISQSWRGHLDAEYMAELLGKEPDEVRKELTDTGLAFENPRTGQLETKEEYLSGKVREKLRQAESYAKNNPDYARNVEALRAVQPQAVPITDITAKLGGGWVPPFLLEKFLAGIGINGVRVAYTQVGENDKWQFNAPSQAEFSEANRRLYGAHEFSAIDLLQMAIEGKAPVVYDYDGKKRTGRNDKNTAEAQAAMERIVKEWEKFAKGDQEITISRDGETVTRSISELTAEAYNEQFNGTIARVYDGSHLTLPGSAPFLLGPYSEGGMGAHQKSGIWRAIQDGSTFLAHGVGAGKTRELIAIAMEWKRLGLAKKPMLVVHNPTLNQFVNETRKIYPGARMLVATKDDLQKENRRSFFARVASGDWDVVVIAHSSFNLIADNPEVVKKFVGAQIAEIEEAIGERLAEVGTEELGGRKQSRSTGSVGEVIGEKSRDPTVKQLVKQLKAFKAKIEKASHLANKDDAVYFQDLGVDALLIDEAHMFKKVPFISKMDPVAGLDRSSSGRAANILMRLNSIREKTNGRNVVLATGTPITNTLAEIWNMIRLTNPQVLKDFGVPTFDQFAAAFTRTEVNWEVHPATNELRPRNRLSKFVNGHGLASFIRTVMDVQMDLELGQPTIEGGGLSAVKTTRTPALEAYLGHLKELFEQWQKLDGESKKEASAIPVVIYGMAKAATMDMRLIDPALPDDPRSKVNVALENVVKFYNQEAERKGTQIVFSDRYNRVKTEYLDAFAGGTFVAPGAEVADESAEADTAEPIDEEKRTAAGEFNLYEDMKSKLIARGIPASEIAIAMDYDSDEKRAALFAKTNAGTIRVLLGSTQKLGVGVNVQERLYAMHHLDVPQTPADLKQRIGRGWRSGNRYKAWDIPIRNLAYGVENTSDAGAYQIIEFKARFADQALQGKAGAEFDDPSSTLVDAAAELKAMFSGDPRMIEMVTLENEIRALTLQEESHQSRQNRFRYELRQAGEREARMRKDLTRRQEQLARLQTVEKTSLTGEELDDIDARLKLGEAQVLNDGANQPENAKMVANKILAPGITLEIYAKGEVRARPAPQIVGVNTGTPEEGYRNSEDPTNTVHKTFADAMAARPVDTTPPVVFRASAALRLDGEAWETKGVTSQRAKAIPELLTDSVTRSRDYIANTERSIAADVQSQAGARAELARPFPEAKELADKQARFTQIRSEIAGTAKGRAYLEEGRGPRGERAVLASGRATLDPNQLEFEQITPEELAAADRAIETATRAERVRENLPLADKIANQFRFPPTGLAPNDVRQEARVALIKAAQEYAAAKGPFAPFAGTVIRNRLRDLFNREIRRIRTQGLSTDAPTEEGSTVLDRVAAPDDTRAGAELAETRRLLHVALDALPARLRGILDARAAGRTLDDIAQEMGISRERVRQLSENAMAFVRAQLKQAGVKKFDNGVLASGRARSYGQRDEEKTGSPLSAEDVQQELFDALAGSPLSGTSRGADHAGADQTPAQISASRAGRGINPFAEIERKLMRNAIQRDRAAEMFNAYLDRKENAPRSRGYEYTGRPSPIKNDYEATRVRDAVRAFDASKTAVFAWPEGLEHLSKHVLYSSSAEDDLAIRDLMSDLARDVPAGAIEQAMSEGSTQTDGARTIGRPDLANPAGPDAASRGVVNAVDEARKETMERETHEQWRTEAVAMIERDRAGVLRDLLAKAQDGQALDNPVQVKAAQLLVNDLIQKAVATKDPAAMRDAQVLAWSYREGGTEQARAFAARRDPFKKPADRYREFLTGAIFTPTPTLRQSLKSSWSPAEKQRRIATLTKQLSDARAEALGLKINGQTTIPADLQKRISQLNTSLGEAQQQKDRFELLNTALAERMKKIEAEFAKMGITLDDIFSGEAYVRLRGATIDNNIFDAANYSTIKKRALNLVKKGWSNAYIAKQTGLTAEQVSGFEQEHIATLRARLAKLGDAALDPDKLDTLNLSSAPARPEPAERGRLASGEASLTPEQRAEKIEQMIRAMGYGRTTEREMRTRRAPNPLRQRQSRGTNPEQAKRVEGLATEPGQTPTFPETHGRPSPDDFADQNTPPGATPAFPTTTGRPGPDDFATHASAPPAFDISNPVHVAQLARTISAVDANKFDMATEFWVNSVLSGPLTQGANIIGNTANAVWDFTFKRAGEAAVNSLVGDSRAPQTAEFAHMLRAAAPALTRAWHNAVRTWTAESPMFENDVLNQQLDLAADFDKSGPTRAAIPGKLGQFIRIPGRLLMATDDFFKSGIAHLEATAQAYRMAKAEGLAGPALESRIRGLVNLPGSPAWVAAVTKANELTFQEKHEGQTAGRMLQLLTKLREFEIGAGSGIKPGRFVLPFVRTPFNIFLQGMRQSPAGAAAMLARFARAGFYRMRDGKPIAESYPRPQMIQHGVEQLFAWTAAALLYGAAAGDDDDEDKQFLITGSIPYKDAGTNALNQRRGLQPFTVRLGRVQISYGRIEPFATILGTTADTIAAMKASRRDKESFDALGALMQSIGQQAEEKTFLRGIGDMISALQGARRGERQNYAAQFLASWVPNIIRQPIAKLDPYVRERSGGFGERLASNIIPQTAAPKVDVYGEKIAQPGLAAWRTLVPVNVRSAPEVNRIDRLLANWYQAHPDEAWAPLPLTRTVRLNQKETRHLTGSELSAYSIRAGRLAAQMLRHAAVNVEHPTAEDLKRVKNAFTSARTITRREMFGARAQEIDSP
jgi:RNA polymerase sigma factor (sigma-70 family)